MAESNRNELLDMPIKQQQQKGNRFSNHDKNVIKSMSDWSKMSDTFKNPYVPS